MKVAINKKITQNKLEQEILEKFPDSSNFTYEISSAGEALSISLTTDASEAEICEIIKEHSTDSVVEKVQEIEGDRSQQDSIDFPLSTSLSYVWPSQQL